MPQARKTLIDLSETLFYHCISRCVRRAFLCGKDQLSGRNFEHRRCWLVERFNHLAQCFTIDICSYAVMSDHYHLVLKVDDGKAKYLSEIEVVRRWMAVYKDGDRSVSRYLIGEAGEAETIVAKSVVNVWRHRLMDISWFMRALNEHIARKANKEDQCKGHFWESRFKSQALLDETAVLSCMAYVDLNPVRAGIAKDLNSSNFTSIKERINTLTRALEMSSTSDEEEHSCYQPHSLFPFGVKDDDVINCSLVDYLILVDTTGRCIRADKKGFIDKSLPPIIECIDANVEQWLELTQHFETIFACFAGNKAILKDYARRHDQAYCQGAGSSFVCK